MNSMDRMQMAPTDRSIPAVRMIRVWPMANAAMTAVCWMMIDNVAGWANRGLMIVKTMMAIDQHQQRAERGMGVQQMLDALHRRLSPHGELLSRSRRRVGIDTHVGFLAVRED